jgi:hypothetical protein
MVCKSDLQEMDVHTIEHYFETIFHMVHEGHDEMAGKNDC